MCTEMDYCAGQDHALDFILGEHKTSLSSQSFTADTRSNGVLPSQDDPESVLIQTPQGNSMHHASPTPDASAATDKYSIDKILLRSCDHGGELKARRLKEYRQPSAGAGALLGSNLNILFRHIQDIRHALKIKMVDAFHLAQNAYEDQLDAMQDQSAARHGLLEIPFADLLQDIVPTAVQNFGCLSIDQKEAMYKNASSNYILPGAADTVEEIGQFVDCYLCERNLSQDQLEVTSCLCLYLECLMLSSSTDPHSGNVEEPPLRILLTGEPGTGKSFIIKTACDLVEIMQLGSVCTTSYNTVAAVNIFGQTISSLFSIGYGGADKVSEAHGHQMPDAMDASCLKLLIIDKIATIDGKTLAIVDARMQQIMRNSKAFGGVACLFVGDFTQLGAVKKTFLPQDRCFRMLKKMRVSAMNKEHDQGGFN
jgi:hypothetical protein